MTSYNYDGIGRLSSVGLGFPGRTTQYSQYDAFGRAGKITPPDGAAHDVLSRTTASGASSPKR